MVQLSTLLLATTACLSAAAPHNAPWKSIVSRGAPTPGTELTLTKTTNNMDAGSFEENGGDIKFKVGDKIGEGSAGRIYTINCDGNAACNELGRVVLKNYIDKEQAKDERNHLAKIGELKAVKNIDGEEYTLLKQWDGVNLSKLPTYVKLNENKEDNYDAIVEFVDQAIKMIADDAKAYIKNNHIFHNDINDANVLLQESDGKITSAKLIDWDKATIFDADSVEDATGEVEDVVNTAFERLKPE
ncbi:hypothetical protein CkaCkLH20_00541 [Colletotrichum karsti]|uniref:Protein kinase domain-containing protein n=1 Tax=Colletotrichum karsti TaxID=1095194 RepID=A0A9P6IKC2_9PEZI|nr:uncharacterized protein CkaCkLH20_00541 [Colletotrichum karsti]KAF9882505.1 hypothetical protein CkaCkLH20_00541 [Colletotrichum karsti]